MARRRASGKSTSRSASSSDTSLVGVNCFSALRIAILMPTLSEQKAALKGHRNG